MEPFLYVYEHIGVYLYICLYAFVHIQNYEEIDCQCSEMNGNIISLGY